MVESSSPASRIPESLAWMPRQPRTSAVGVIRLGVGLSLVVAPAWAGRVWVGPGADGPGSRVFARAIGARDVVLGMSILMGVRGRKATAQLVQLGFAADAADAVATILAARNLTPTRRIAMPLIALGVGALGYLASSDVDGGTEAAAPHEAAAA